MKILAEKIGKRGICFVPEEVDVKAEIEKESIKLNAYKGKKRKGHGALRNLKRNQTSVETY